MFLPKTIVFLNVFPRRAKFPLPALQAAAPFPVPAACLAPPYLRLPPPRCSSPPVRCHCPLAHGSLSALPSLSVHVLRLIVAPPTVAHPPPRHGGRHGTRTWRRRLRRRPSMLRKSSPNRVHRRIGSESRPGMSGSMSSPTRIGIEDEHAMERSSRWRIE